MRQTFYDEAHPRIETLLAYMAIPGCGVVFVTVDHQTISVAQFLALWEYKKKMKISQNPRL